MVTSKSPYRNHNDTERRLKLLTLNCWGLIFAKDYHFRMMAIAKKLAESDYDLVVLQEIFSENDIKNISEAVKDTLPHFHYFYNGFLGSGVMMLSKYRLKDTLIIPYTQNGMFYDTGGDWFAGKSICHALIRPWEDCSCIHVFGTHTHAAYNHDPNSELRAMQLFQLARVVRQISRKKEPVLLMGDLNTTPGEIGIRYLLHHCSLKDSCYEKHHQKSTNMYTANAPTGAYHTCKNDPPSRLDYIMYSSHFECEDCGLNFERIDDATDKSYSDHCGVETHVVYHPENALFSKKTEENDHEIELSNEMMAQLGAGLQKSYFSFNQITWIAIIASLTLTFTRLVTSLPSRIILLFLSILLLTSDVLTVYVCKRTLRRTFLAALSDLKSTREENDHNVRMA